MSGGEDLDGGPADVNNQYVHGDSLIETDIGEAVSHTWSDQCPSIHGLTGLRQSSTLGGDHLHKLVPGFDKRFGTVFLELGGQGINVDAGPGEPR